MKWYLLISPWIMNLLILTPLFSEISGDEGIYPVLREDKVIERALKFNHEVIMVKKREDIMKQRILREGSLPDPMFMIGYENEGWERFTYGTSPDSRWMFSLSQTVPFPGKLSLKREIAKKELEIAQILISKTKLKIIEEVRNRILNLYLAHKTFEIAVEKQRLLLMLEELVRSRYISGMVPLSELTMAQMERYMSEENLLMAKQKIKSEEYMINNLMGREPSLPLGIPEEPVSSSIELQPETIIEKALTSFPEIKEKSKILESKEINYKLARKEYYPDFTFTGTVYKKPDPYEDMWGLSVSINIPLFYKKRQEPMVREAVSEKEESFHELESERLNISSMVYDTYNMYITGRETMKLYEETLIPKARENFEATLTNYRSGRVELTSVIKALNILIDTELNYLNRVMEYKRAIIRLYTLMGEQ